MVFSQDLHLEGGRVRERLSKFEYRTLEQAHLNPRHVFGDHAPPEAHALVKHALQAYDNEVTYQNNKGRRYAPQSNRVRDIMP